MNIRQIQTNWTGRYHVRVDDDASGPLNCFVVELPPYTTEQGMCVWREGASMNELWSEALHTLAFLRQQPYAPVLPESVFVPFGFITARNAEDVQREHEVRREMMGAGMFHADARWRAAVERNPVLHENGRHHERLVAELSRAWDLLNGAPLPQSTGTFPPIRH